MSVCKWCSEIEPTQSQNVLKRTVEEGRSPAPPELIFTKHPLQLGGPMMMKPGVTAILTPLSRESFHTAIILLACMSVPLHLLEVNQCSDE